MNEEIRVIESEVTTAKKLYTTPEHKLAENLKNFMEDTLMSQQELADLTGVAQSTISYILQKKTSATLEIVAKIAYGIGVDVYDLLMDDEDADCLRHISYKASPFTCNR